MREREREKANLFLCPGIKSPMNDSNNHYMKLISPFNNKTLIILERKDKATQAPSPIMLWAFEDTW